MKPFISSLLLIAACAVQPVHADPANSSTIGSAGSGIALGAPGVATGSQIASKLPFSTEVTLTGIYRFVFSGMEAKGNTLGAPGSSGTDGNGGQFHLTGAAWVNSDRVKEGGISFRDEQDYNASPLVTVTNDPIVFKATTDKIDVTVQWKGEGNAKKPDGFFNILGDYQAAPPVPTGSLSFSNVSSDGYILKDATPDGTVKITRE